MSIWVAVVQPKTRRVLLARRAPHTTNGGKWNFFGGGVDPGEHPLATAIRELREESGLTAVRRDLIPLGEAQSPSKLNILFGLIVPDEVIPKLNGESSAWAWVPVAELAERGDLHPSTALLRPHLERWIDQTPRMSSI